MTAAVENELRRDLACALPDAACVMHTHMPYATTLTVA